jgi:TRAP-type uncharacterized transport system substrate-binding protein
MNTFQYISIIVKDEFRAIREEFVESKLLVLAFFVALFLIIFYLDPFPSKHIYFATSYPNSDWHNFVKKTTAALNEKGLEVTLINTDGAIDNVIRLNNPKDKANVAFTYGAALNQDQIRGIYSLGSIFYEPVWIFYRKNKIHALKSMKDLASYKVGVGPAKSGSLMIAKKLLLDLDVDITKNSNFISGSFIDIHEQFLKGDLDAIMIVSTYLDPIVQNLLREPKVALYSFSNANAYERKYNYLEAVNIPAGSIDLLNQIPPKDIELISTTASLVVRKDLHPDLQLALLMTIKEVTRSSANLFFAKRNEFPAYVDPSIHISPVAQRFYDYGPPHTAQYLPYWLAGFFDRSWLFILALFTIIYPLTKLNIHLRKFRFTLKERPHYEELLEMEKRLCTEKLSQSEKQQFLIDLDKMNKHAIEGGVPVGEEADYFNFLNAINLMRIKIVSN